MGPQSNPELFKQVGESIQNNLSEEFRRRALVGSTLQEINQLFELKDNSPRPVVEATLTARLYALSAVQRSRMGINGFQPLAALRYDGSVEAKTAPSHDEFDGGNGDVFRSRIISFSSEGLGSDIKVFGLNLYCPVPGEDTTEEEQPSAEKREGFVVVDRRGVSKAKIQPVSGETVLFAVYHKQTQEAKYYQVNAVPPESTPLNPHSESLKFVNEHEAFVSLPDSQAMHVQLLTGEVQSQANAEFLAGLDMLKDLGGVRESLTPEERLAVDSLPSADPFYA